MDLHLGKNGVPEINAATEETVRKDTIMVPAGGYVVIEFLADNPGYWFMHCHIEPHLVRGMAAVIREDEGLPEPGHPVRPERKRQGFLLDS